LSYGRTLLFQRLGFSLPAEITNLSMYSPHRRDYRDDPRHPGHSQPKAK